MLESGDARAAHDVKQPWLAANLSFLLPGLGQHYVGARAAALGFGLLALSLLLPGALFIFAPNLFAPAGMLAVIFGWLVWLLSVWDAHRRARRTLAEEQDDDRRSRRDGWKAAFLTRFLPGLGHAYDRRFAPAIVFFLTFVVLSAIEHPVAEAAAAVVAGFAFWDSLSRSDARSGPRRPTAIGISVAVAVVFWLGAFGGPWLRTHLLRAFRTPSAGMTPTLEPGDLFFVDMRAGYEPRMGDVIVFKFPEAPSRDFVQRCVATAGQTIELKNKRVLVDGAPAPAADAHAYHLDPSISCGPDVHPYKEDARLVTCRDNFGPFRVPPGRLFMMGDNRENSNDSRYWGPLGMGLVRGRAYKIYWPPGHARPLK